MPTDASHFEYQNTIVNGVTTASITGFSAAGLFDPTTEIDIPATSSGGYAITKISDNAFDRFLKPNSKNLTKVILSNAAITEIGKKAFHFNQLLTNVVFNTELELIDNEAFEYCNILQLEFFQNLNTISFRAFAENHNLFNLDIYKSKPLIFIDVFAFTCAAHDENHILTVYLNWNNEQVRWKNYNDSPDDRRFHSNTIFVNHCFLEGTLILTPSGYKPVESLKQGDLVRTLEGDKPMDTLLRQPFYHDASAQRSTQQLFTMNYPSVFQPLIMTGAHSTLVVPTPKEMESIQAIPDVREPVEGLYRLPAFVDEKASVYEVSGKYNVYHVIIGTKLEGIFANGLLVESCKL